MKYELVCGLEVHARVKTNTKLWCWCSADVFWKEPNSSVCPVCLWFPGQLPVLNQEAVNKAVLTWKALNCEIPEFSKFDRKSYFYPDLPTWFQTSQFDEPVCGLWEVEVYVEWEKKKFWITRIHLENDAWKLTHTSWWTEVDLNRAGCPLMEIVTEPDFRSLEDVKSFLQNIQKTLRAIWTSDADMEKWQMRADVNISLRPFWQKEMWIRTELKNMNSFSAIEKALTYEYKRQAKALDKWETLAQETRGWDDAKWISVSQRSKEEAADYRYFPEPDLPPLTVEKKYVDWLTVPELPIQKFERLQSQYWIKEDDAFLFSSDTNLCNYFEKTAELSWDAKKSSSWILSELIKFTKEDLIWVEESKVTPKHIASIIKMIADWEISWKIAKDVFPEVYKTWKNPEEIVEEKWLKQNSNTDELKIICEKIIADNQAIVETYKSWKDKAFWALVGQAMKATKWQANPWIVNKILKEIIW